MATALKPDNALQLAAWIAQNNPALFQALADQADVASARLNGVTDFLKSVGTTFSDAVSKVGSFLTSDQGLATVGTLGTAYFANKASQNALKTQIALASSGNSLAPLQTMIGANGQPVPIDARTGQPVTNFAPYQPSLLSQYGMPLAIGAGVLLLVFALKR